MSKTPRTDAAIYPMDRVDVVFPDFARRLESDLADCLATLESVRDYLKAGHCFCYHSATSEYLCFRCRMLEDVETTIKNTKP